MATFLDLPAELRNRIYDLALVKDTPTRPQDPTDRAEERSVLNIFLSNKQIGAEAKSIYFSPNIFCFTAVDVGRDWNAAHYLSSLRLFFRHLDELSWRSLTHLRFEALAVDANEGSPFQHRCGCLVYVTLDLRAGPDSVKGSWEHEDKCCGYCYFLRKQCESRSRCVSGKWRALPQTWMDSRVSKLMGIVTMAKEFAWNWPK